MLSARCTLFYFNILELYAYVWFHGCYPCWLLSPVYVTATLDVELSVLNCSKNGTKQCSRWTIHKLLSNYYVMFIFFIHSRFLTRKYSILFIGLKNMGAFCLITVCYKVVIPYGFESHLNLNSVSQGLYVLIGISLMKLLSKRKYWWKSNFLKSSIFFIIY